MLEIGPLSVTQWTNPAIFVSPFRLEEDPELCFPTHAKPIERASLLAKSPR